MSTKNFFKTFSFSNSYGYWLLVNRIMKTCRWTVWLFFFKIFFDKRNASCMFVKPTLTKIIPIFNQMFSIFDISCGYDSLEIFFMKNLNALISITLKIYRKPFMEGIRRHSEFGLEDFYRYTLLQSTFLGRCISCTVPPIVAFEYEPPLNILAKLAHYVN